MIIAHRRTKEPEHPCYHCYSSAWVYDVRMQNYRCNFCYPEGQYPNIDDVAKRAAMHRAEVEQAQGKEQETMQEEKAPMQARNGVVTDTHLYLFREGKIVKKRLPEIQNVGDLLQLCLDSELDALWMLAQTEISDRGTQTFIEDEQAVQAWDIKNPQFTRADIWEDEQARCTYLKAWKRKEARREGESGRSVHLGYAEYADTWGLDKIASPLVLLGTLTYIEDALQVPIRYSAQSVGKNLMKAFNKDDRLSWIRPVDLAQYEPVKRTKVIDVSWKREISEDEQQQFTHLIAADKNSQFPASCTGATLGSGSPEYEEFPQFDIKKPLPGVYHLQHIVNHDSPFDGVQLPHPIDGKTGGWFWTYTVKLLLELGYTFSLTEAYVWREHHTILRPWVEGNKEHRGMWKARAVLDKKNPLYDAERYSSEEARSLACKAIKSIANSSLGLLDKPREFEREEASEFYRPDWYMLIRDNARYLMFWKMRAYLEKDYCALVGVQSDCLYYLVKTDNYIEALPKMFDRERKLGGYKSKYSKTITLDQVLPLFNSKRDMGQINTMLNKYNAGEIEL